MILKYDKEGMFYTESKYEEKDLIKSEHFMWNSELRRWETNDYSKALSLIRSSKQKNFPLTIDDAARDEINARRTKDMISIGESVSSYSGITVPAPEGESYRPYQLAAIEFISKRDKVLLADEMGLGKTIEIIGWINYQHPKSVLIVAPRIAVYTVWKFELARWLVHPYDIVVVSNEPPVRKDNTIYLMHYEQLTKYYDYLLMQYWDNLVFDESQYVKNFRANRTKIAYELSKLVKEKKILVTGTPVSNNLQLLEAYTQLRILDVPEFRSRGEFYSKYVDMGNYGRTINSAKYEKFQYDLRATVMLRRMKKDVLPELPPKTRQQIIYPKDSISTVLQKENKDFLSKITTIHEIGGGNWTSVFGTLSDEDKGEISRIRKETAVAKLPLDIEFIEELLEEEDKVVVFAHHIDVLEGIYAKFKDKAVLIDGNVSEIEREEAIARFRDDPSVNLFVGSVRLASESISLTSSSTCVFVEFDWNPGVLYQAEDRLHRPGQTAESVVIKYIAVEGTIDSFMLSNIIPKADMMNRVLNKDSIGVIRQ